MCGRFAVHASPEAIARHFMLADIEDFPPRYNIAPTQPILAVVRGPRRALGSNLPDRQAMLARWGLIPGWMPNTASLPLLINARSETAAEKPAFRAAMRHRRALFPASGFYEWRRSGREGLQAYWIRPRDGGILAFGGLVETYAEPGGSEIDTGAILTTTANDDLAEIHDRMPVIIHPRDFSRWLDCISNEPRHIADLMRPFPSGLLEAVPVSDRVNKVTNTGPDLQHRVDLTCPATAGRSKPGSTGQLDLFQS